MADRTKKAFRGSVHGFKRKDVNGYILELSKKYTETENELRKKIASLEAENKKLTSRLAEAESRAAGAETKSAEDKSTSEDAKKAAEALSEIKRIRSRLKKQVREFESKYSDVLPFHEKREKSGSKPVEEPKPKIKKQKPVEDPKTASEEEKPVEEPTTVIVDEMPVEEPKAAAEEEKPAEEPKTAVEETPVEEPESARDVEIHVETPEPAVSEEKTDSQGDDFESYLKEFRSSTSALFSEFDKKYGTKFSGGEK